MDDFSNVKVGDRLWSTVAGWTSVIEINSVAVIVRTLSGDKEVFSLKGNSYDCPEYPQSLFFEEMQLIPKAFMTYSPDENNNWETPHTTGSTDSEYDLINIPERIQGWVNIYDDYIVTVHSQGDYIASRETADQMASSKRIACIPISFIKGEGLND